MPQSYRDYLAKCPFFTTTDNNRLRCSEGPVMDSRVQITFKNGKILSDYRHSYCCERYEQCKVYKILCEKYEEESQ